MPKMTERFQHALLLACKLHENQTRKSGDGGTPYISHLLRVTGLVQEYGGDEDTAIAAVLHDAVEDQGGMETAERIRREFGDRVTGFVLECSDSTGAAGEKKLPWKGRKDQYLAHLRTATPEATLISACDKLDNVTSLTRNLPREGVSFFARFQGGKDGLFWYFGQIAEILAEKNSPVTAEYQAALAQLKETESEHVA